MENFGRDLRYALRQLRNAPGFTVAAIATIALGIGANTAIFSVVYALLLKSLPFHRADRIVSILETHPQTVGAGEVTYPDFVEWQREQGSFEALAAYSSVNPESVAMSAGGRSEQVRRELASGNFFSVLGVTPLLGRTLNERDEVEGSDHVAVISAGAWQQYFGRDPGVIGRVVQLDGTSFTVIGVLPPGASFPANGDVWLPLSLLDKPTQESHVWHSLRVLGRLRNGIGLNQARADMAAIAARIAAANPATNRNVGVELEPIREKLVGAFRPAIMTVMFSVFLVLFIACANVAGLLLVQAAAREKDIAIRRSLGATYGRLFSQHLAEALVIGMLGAIAGTILAWGLEPLFRVTLTHIAGFNASLAEEIHLSAPVMLFTLSTCLATTMIFGLVPLVKTLSDAKLARSAGNRGHSASGRVGRQILISTEIALAVGVLFLSSLTVKSFSALLSVDTGYRTQGLLTFEISLPGQKYQPGAAPTNQFYEELFSRIERIPGVVSVASTTQEPLTPSLAMTRFLIDGAPRLAPGAFPMAQIRFVSPRFFETMGLGLQDGRIFSQKELDDQASLMVVNRTFAKNYLFDREPTNAHVLLGVLTPKPSSVPVIGVVSDAHETGIELQPPPEIFLPGFGLHEVILVRAGSDLKTIAATVSAIVHDMNPDQPVYNVQTIMETLSNSVALQRMTAYILGIFASVSLLLAVIGIYGALAFSVAQRTREIGVRMALGAKHAHVIWLVLREAARLSVAGLIAGFAIALAGARFLDRFLFKTSAVDPISIAFTALILIGVIVLASALPARRAALLNPSEALRTE